MNDSRYEIITEELRVKIEISSTLPDSGESQVYTQLVTHLIEEAPTSFWQKSRGELEPSDYLAQVMAAVARAYAYELAHYTPTPAHELLKQLIGELVEMNYLQEILPVRQVNDDE